MIDDWYAGTNSVQPFRESTPPPKRAKLDALGSPQTPDDTSPFRYPGVMGRIKPSDRILRIK